MIVCANCGVEMRCTKTGMNVIIDEHTYFRGDTFQCMTCGNKIVKTNEEHAYTELPLTPGAYDVIFKEGGV